MHQHASLSPTYRRFCLILIPFGGLLLSPLVIIGATVISGARALNWVDYLKDQFGVDVTSPLITRALELGPLIVALLISCVSMIIALPFAIRWRKRERAYFDAEPGAAHSDALSHHIATRNDYVNAAILCCNVMAALATASLSAVIPDDFGSLSFFGFFVLAALGWYASSKLLARAGIQLKI